MSIIAEAGTASAAAVGAIHSAVTASAAAAGAVHSAVTALQKLAEKFIVVKISQKELDVAERKIRGELIEKFDEKVNSLGWQARCQSYCRNPLICQFIVLPK